MGILPLRVAQGQNDRSLSLAGRDYEVVDEAGGADEGGDGEEGAVASVGEGQEGVGIDDGGVVEADGRGVRAGVGREDAEHGGAEGFGGDFAVGGGVDR